MPFAPQPPPQRLADHITGCLIGGAIGDAWGSTVEHRSSISDVELPWGYTDDTQMTLATCEAISETQEVQPASLARVFVRWFQAGRFTGLGASTLKALRDLAAGAHPALSGARGDRAAGNGAAMRIAPLAFVLNPNHVEDRRIIREVCRITHHHDEAYVGALAVLQAIRTVQDRPLNLLELADHLPDSRVRDQLIKVAADGQATIQTVARQFGSSGFVAESVPLALFAAVQGEDLGFTGMLTEIMAAGGDTDTIGSMAGQVLGARLGRAALPDELVKRLPESSMLGLIGDFAHWASMRHAASRTE